MGRKPKIPSEKTWFMASRIPSTVKTMSRVFQNFVNLSSFSCSFLIPTSFFIYSSPFLFVRPLNRTVPFPGTVRLLKWPGLFPNYISSLLLYVSGPRRQQNRRILSSARWLWQEHRSTAPEALPPFQEGRPALPAARRSNSPLPSNT